MGGYDANEVLRTAGADALRDALDAGHTKASRETQHALAELNRGVAELRSIPVSERSSRAPVIARRLSGFIAQGLHDKGTVQDAIFQFDINNWEFKASIVSAIEAGIRTHSANRAAAGRSPPVDSAAVTHAPRIAEARFDAHDATSANKTAAPQAGLAVDIPEKTAKRDDSQPDAIRMSDFVAFMPTHSYFFMPTRDTWPAASVNARIKPILQENGKSHHRERLARCQRTGRASNLGTGQADAY